MKPKAPAALSFSRKPDPKVRAALFFGPDRSRVEETANELTATVLGAHPDPINLTRLGEDDLRKDKARLADELAAQSLLGGARVVRVRADGDSQAEIIVAAVKHLDAGLPVGAYLIVEGGDLKKTSKIRKAFEDSPVCVAIPFYDEGNEERASFASGLLRESGLNLTIAAREAFMAGLPDDRGGVRGEVEKLIAFAHGLDRPIDEADVRALSIAASEAEIDDAALAALNGQAEAAARALERAEGAQGVTMLKTLERRLLRLAEAQTMIAYGGISIGDAGDKLRPAVFWKEKDAFTAQLRVWSLNRIQTALNRLWVAEIACKSAGAPAFLIAAETYAEIGRLASSGRR